MSTLMPTSKHPGSRLQLHPLSVAHQSYTLTLVPTPQFLQQGEGCAPDKGCYSWVWLTRAGPSQAVRAVALRGGPFHLHRARPAGGEREG
ncbi:hypothetical protein EYF80_054203 [Liparis tanakae]|uniref:Uncharacterized protein n=1 Tax=Liparis tanakae TaxID=230148 RepID=A0A4Z2F412_9TELE|nr:hypothetical protein EYF80_054203 [Liparis tanakae]